MRKITILAASVAALTMTLAGCVHDNKETLKCPVHFKSTIEGHQTRVSGEFGDEWDADDQIGIYMYPAGEDFDHVDAKNNILHTHVGDGEFDGVDLYYPGGGAFVSFVAYYPYYEDLHNVDGHVYQVDVTDQTQNIDLMYAPVVTKNEDPVNLQFSHQLSRLIFYVSDVTGADLTNVDIQIVGMPTTGTFDLTAAAEEIAVEVNAESVETFDAKYISIAAGVARVEAIVMPGEVDYSLFVTLADGSTAPVPVGTRTYAKGKQYIYNVSLDMIQKKVDLIEGNITGWGDGDEGGEDLNGIKTPPVVVPPAIDGDTFMSEFDDVTEIPAAADDFMIMFSILNPVENATLSFEGTSEWITVTEVPAQAGRTRAAESKDVELNAAVAKNTVEAPRTGTIVIKYNGATLKTITFTQAAGTPAGTSNLLFPGSDFNGDPEVTPTGKFTTINPTAGIDGTGALVMDGTNASNGDGSIFEFSSVDVAGKSIAFWIKGTTTLRGLNVTFNGNNSGTGNIAVLGDCSSDTTISTYGGSGSYNTAINTNGQWVKITLTNLPSGASPLTKLTFRAGGTSGATFDLAIDNIIVE